MTAYICRSSEHLDPHLKYNKNMFQCQNNNSPSWPSWISSEIVGRIECCVHPLMVLMLPIKTLLTSLHTFLQLQYNYRDASKKQGGGGGMMEGIGVQDIIHTDLVSDSDCWKYHFRGTQFYFFLERNAPGPLTGNHLWQSESASQTPFSEILYLCQNCMYTT